MLRKILITCSLIFAAVTVTVSAEAEGYIFKLKEDAVIPFSVSDGVERLTDNTPVYSAESIEDAYEFVDESAIEYIGRDARVYLYDRDFEDKPNDLYYEQYQWNLPLINIPEVWKKGYRGEGATVCVIDSGVNIAHEDIDEDNIIAKYNVFDSSKDVTDSMGHGTFVTGVIGATINNNFGIAGIADEADIISIKAFDKGRETKISNLISALENASQYEDLDVINMSLGTTDKLEDGTKAIFYDAIDSLVKKGVIIIAAVGNDGNTNISYPAGFDNVIGVGGVAKNKKKCYFSQMNESVFVVAPGGTEKQGGKDGLVGLLNVDNKIGMGSGTSYASPQVAAVAAIAKSICPRMTSEQFMDILKNTSEDLGENGYDTSYGYGLIDAEKVIDEVEELAARPVESPTAEPTTEPTVTPDETFNPDMYRELKYDSDSNSITIDTDDKEAVVFSAKYESDGTLTGIKIYKISELTGDNGVYTITLENGEKEPSRLFLWNNMRSCIAPWINENIPEPTRAPVSEPTAEPTAEPTKAPVTEPTEEPDVNVLLANNVIELINNDRKEAGVPELITDSVAMPIMKNYAIDMIANGYTNNTVDSSGKRPADYIAEATEKSVELRLYPIGGINGNTPPRVIVNAILQRYSEHVLSAEYTQIAVGVAKDEFNTKSAWAVAVFKYGD